MWLFLKKIQEQNVQHDFIENGNILNQIFQTKKKRSKEKMSKIHDNVEEINMIIYAYIHTHIHPIYADIERGTRKVNF